MTTNETICAIATAPGGALSIIRISGPEAIACADKLFRPAAGTRPLAARKASTLTFGTICDPASGEVVDEVLASLFRAPHSYTGEDSVELSCHGSRYILQRTVELLIAAGCRQALPGEFTKRAFLNGKLDLSQAEAVADVIASETAAAHKMAIGQMRGNFSRHLASLREQLLHLTTLMELELDFSDHEELEFADRSQLMSLAREIESSISRLAASFRLGNAIKKGVPVAIIGATNAGKSTLLNALVGEDRAIVSDVHGTTRDVIEDTVNIQGITFRFIDTAGIRDTSDTVESLGIEKTFEKLSQADIVVWLVDATDPASAFSLSGRILPLVTGKTFIVVFNKADLVPTFTPSLPDNFPADTRNLAISARRGTGLAALQHLFVSSVDTAAITGGDVIVSNLRHYEALKTALSAIRRVISGLTDGLPTDLVSQDLRDVLAALADITGGAITTPEVLNNVFSRFCVGK